MSESALVRVAGTEESSHRGRQTNVWLPLALAVATAIVFWLSINPNQQHFDYTYRIADALLQGHLGLFEQPSWLNELVPVRGEYYSVFPLGAVLVVTPVAALGKAALLSNFPGRDLAAIIAGACVYFFFQLSGTENNSLGRRILLALFPVFGTWTWCNLGFAGAWQIALGFALLGEAAALYFTLVRPRPLLAGICFALSFGNRTEVILTLPIFIYFWVFRRTALGQSHPHEKVERFRSDWRPFIKFLAIPAILAVCTGIYNFARFNSIFDFGYARIPHLIAEPWYRQGLFSLSAIPWNVHKMLFEGMESLPDFPYLRPYPFGCSIFLASPFLFLLSREGGRYRTVCWLAIGALTLALWCHGNPGGWQFSYRYATILLPWMFLLLVGNGPRTLSTTELSLFLVSISINAVATYQFLWTSEIKP